MTTQAPKQAMVIMDIRNSIWIFILICCNCLGCIQENKDNAVELPIQSKAQQNIDLIPYQSKLHNGDLVLRTGNDVISSMFAQLNKKNKKYSHCGIAFMENNVWYVYHSIGGEDNPDERLRKDSFERFVSKAHNIGFGICHYDLSTLQTNQLQQIVKDYHAKGIPFDMKFDLQSDERLYCAEMVYKAFNKALGQDNFFETTTHQGFKYVSTDNLFMNNKAHILCELTY